VEGCESNGGKRMNLYQVDFISKHSKYDSQMLILFAESQQEAVKKAEQRLRVEESDHYQLLEVLLLDADKVHCYFTGF
jgi:hypothetical protein